MTTACTMTDISVLQHRFGPRHPIHSDLKKIPNVSCKNHQRFSNESKNWRYDHQKTKDPFPIPTGCQQGSLLSPFPRNLIIYDIVRLLSEYSIPGWALAYADDISATEQQKGTAIAESFLQTLINRIKSKLKSHKLNVNAEKTASSSFAESCSSQWKPVEYLQQTRIMAFLSNKTRFQYNPVLPYRHLVTTRTLLFLPWGNNRPFFNKQSTNTIPHTGLLPFFGATAHWSSH